jgi:hypothetical protein
MCRSQISRKLATFGQWPSQSRRLCYFISAVCFSDIKKITNVQQSSCNSKIYAIYSKSCSQVECIRIETFKLLIDGAWKAQKRKAGPTGKTAMATLDIP